MITEIYIRDLGVIREARLPFKPGLNVLTGETGAGKTMVLTALGLLLGERSDSGAVRAGAAQALVEGRWNQIAGEVRERVESAGANLDDDELIANRSVSSEGKSRAALGGAAVPVSLLSEIGNQLVVVHGQADQIRLKSAAAQREALDAFANLAPQLAIYKKNFEEWRQKQALLAQILGNRTANAVELAKLLADLEEIETVSPKPGEDKELALIADRMTNLESLKAAAAIAHEALAAESDNADVSTLLGVAKRALEQQVSNDEQFAGFIEKITELSLLIADLSNDLSSYLSALDIDSELSLDEIQGRRAQLNSVIRKHGNSLEDVFEFSETASRRVLELDDSDERIDELRSELETTHKALLSAAAEISTVRKAAAKNLELQVNLELAGLAMAGAELVVEVADLDELTVHGANQISLALKSYAGAEPRPIGKGASGGELSRIMLALEVVLAKGHQAPTFIFDEVDAGVGGAAAIEVGRRLSRLSKDAQVIVVTHLAQVAAFADNHHKVSKSSSGDITESGIETLNEDDRRAELARMLSGLSGSDSALEHAAELMSLAKASVEP